MGDAEAELRGWGSVGLEDVEGGGESGDRDDLGVVHVRVRRVGVPVTVIVCWTIAGVVPPAIRCHGDQHPTACRVKRERGGRADVVFPSRCHTSTLDVGDNLASTPDV